jgi:hypothetical protein
LRLAQLFDHLVDKLLEMRRHVEAERLCGLEVDNYFVFARGLHRKLTRLIASHYPINGLGAGVSPQAIRATALQIKLRSETLPGLRAVGIIFRRFGVLAVIKTPTKF